MYFIAQQFVSPKGLPQATANSNTFGSILQIVFTIIGALALLMLVIAGFRYVISSGEPQKTAEIRRQIIYTAIGLILAASADAIVTIIINKAS